MAGRQFFLFSCILLAFTFSAKADENLVELVKKIKPAVVLIQTFDKDNKPLGQGSGFFVNNKGHIVTNHHVLEGAYRATVKTSSGIEYPVEGVIAKNADADIVKLVANIPDANTPFLNLSTNVPSEGEDVVVIGNPLGLESTVSSGIVSAVRDIPAFGKILQITAPISPGSSGSPVINSKGEVIGIATLIMTKGQNLNFAIPSDKIIALKETSQTSISNALTADSNDAQLFYQKGLKELWQDNYVAALIFFQKAIEKNPQDADVWFSLGYCYGELGHYQDAIESCKQAIRIKPDYAEAHNNLGNTYNKLGLYQDAIQSCKQAIRIKPDYALAHYNLGGIYGNLGRYQDEIESYKQAIRIKPDFADAHYNLGAAYGELGRWQEAIESFKQAIRIKPDDALSHYSLGIAYLVVGDKGSALEEYKILKTLDTERAKKLFNMIYK
jgi:tetratricopeptide (TPR) repeat protein